MSAIALSPETLPAIIWKNQPVITTGLLATIYGAKEVQIQQNFNNNTNRFIEGIHYFMVKGADLKELKLHLDKIEVQISNMARKLYLWTERGTVRHAKILDTDNAWAIQDRLEDSYFSKNQPQYGLKQLPEPPTITKAEAGLLFNTVNSIAGDDNKMRSAIWKRFQNHFKVNSYKFLPAEKFDEAIQYLEQKRIEYRNGLTMLYVSDKELQTLISEGVKAKEGEFLPKQQPVDNTSLTITLAPLNPGEVMKRWLITHHGDDMVQMWAVKPDTEVKQRDHFIRDLKTDGYLVIKKDEFSIGNFVMEQVPHNYLPVLIETAGKRLRAIDR